MHTYTNFCYWNSLFGASTLWCEASVNLKKQHKLEDEVISLSCSMQEEDYDVMPLVERIDKASYDFDSALEIEKM